MTSEEPKQELVEQATNVPTREELKRDLVEQATNVLQMLQIITENEDQEVGG